MRIMRREVRAMENTSILSQCLLANGFPRRFGRADDGRAGVELIVDSAGAPSRLLLAFVGAVLWHRHCCLWFWFPSRRKPHRQECLCHNAAMPQEYIAFHA